MKHYENVLLEITAPTPYLIHIHKYLLLLYFTYINLYTAENLFRFRSFPQINSMPISQVWFLVYVELKIVKMH